MSRQESFQLGSYFHSGFVICTRDNVSISEVLKSVPKMSLFFPSAVFTLELVCMAYEDYFLKINKDKPLNIDGTTFPENRKNVSFNFWQTLVHPACISAIEHLKTILTLHCFQFNLPRPQIGVLQDPESGISMEEVGDFFFLRIETTVLFFTLSLGIRLTHHLGPTRHHCSRIFFAQGQPKTLR